MVKVVSRHLWSAFSQRMNTTGNRWIVDREMTQKDHRKAPVFPKIILFKRDVTYRNKDRVPFKVGSQWEKSIFPAEVFRAGALMSLQPPQGKEVSRVCSYPFNLNISVSFQRRQRWKPLTRISTGSPSGALRTTWKGTPGTSPIASNLLR